MPPVGASLLLFTESLYSLHGSFTPPCYTVLGIGKSRVQPVRCTETNEKEDNTMGGGMMGGFGGSVGGLGLFGGLHNTRLTIGLLKETRP